MYRLFEVNWVVIDTSQLPMPPIQQVNWGRLILNFPSNLLRQQQKVQMHNVGKHGQLVWTV